MSKHIQPNENNCCGCRSCENVCPKGAINVLPDKKGFLYPNIDKDSCIDCGLCVKACPIIKKEEAHSEFQQKVYAVINGDKEVLKKSASGGAFSLLADEVLKNNGIVYGCTLTDDMQVVHIDVDNEEDLQKLRGSKYVQSDLKETYKEIGQHLKDGRPVLFTGTPCQVDGLNFYLKAKNQSTEGLLTVDLLCHGVPSPKLWADFVNYLEKTYKSKLTDFKFRTKIAGWENSIETATFENGKTIKNTNQVRSFLALFYQNVSLRPMCYSCRYNSYKRVSDITIGDYWGIDKSHPEINDNKGLSVVLVNTGKGNWIFEKVLTNAKVLETKKEDAIQQALERNPTAKRDVDKFWQEYHEKGFDFIIQKYGIRSKASLIKVKIITLLYKVRLLKFFKKFI
ncbi:MAG: 4Fe-4S dicluster domain-containing protein [Ruminococcaceae bacterium]|nr:4Fe-4S dicluster domain-containing protein [Oscillospiraceae bacterium]